MIGGQKKTVFGGPKVRKARKAEKGSDKEYKLFKGKGKDQRRKRKDRSSSQSGLSASENTE